MKLNERDINMLRAVLSGRSMAELARENGCTAPNIRRLVMRAKEAIGYKPGMTVEQVEQRIMDLRELPGVRLTPREWIVGCAHALKTLNDNQPALFHVAPGGSLLYIPAGEDPERYLTDAIENLRAERTPTTPLH